MGKWFFNKITSVGIEYWFVTRFVKVLPVYILALSAFFSGSASALNMATDGIDNMNLSSGGAFLHSTNDRLQVYLIRPEYNIVNNDPTSTYRRFDVVTICLRKATLFHPSKRTVVCRIGQYQEKIQQALGDQDVVAIDTYLSAPGREDYQVFVQLTDTARSHHTTFYGVMKEGSDPSPNIAPYTVAGTGWFANGADVALANIGGDAQRLDMVMMSYDDPEGSNSFRYRVGWDVNAHGRAQSWSGIHQVAGLGWKGEGAGATLGNLDNNPRPDMMLMAIDPGGAHKTFRYRIAWNLDAAGKPSAVGPATVLDTRKLPPVSFNSASAAFGQMDSDPRPDVILVGLTNEAESQASRFKYLIGYNFNSNGYASSWSDIKQYDNIDAVPVEHDLGDFFKYYNEAEGMGVDIADLNGNGIPDLVLTSHLAYENFLSIYNGFNYFIGWDLVDGEPSRWSLEHDIVRGVGEYALGAGIAIGDIDHDGEGEFVLMGMENILNGSNDLRYRVHHYVRCRFC